MVIQVKEKGPASFRSDVGQFHVMSGKLVLWVYSHRLNNKNDELRIRDFNMPSGVKSVEIIDQDSGHIIKVPLRVFLASYKEGVGYSFKYEEWSKKYRKVI